MSSTFHPGRFFRPSAANLSMSAVSMNHIDRAHAPLRRARRHRDRSIGSIVIVGVARATRVVSSRLDASSFVVVRRRLAFVHFRPGLDMVVPARDDVDDGDDDEADGDARACRAYLRARAMRVWRELVGREVEITLRGAGAPAATGVFAGVDADETTFLVESLTSALGTTPKARVRCSDVLSLRVRGRRDDGGGGAAR